MTDKRRSMTPAKILALSGSSRRDSLNSRLLRAAAAMLEEAGAEVTLADLAEYEMPLYNGDLENRDGPPENQACLKALFRDHAGLLIAAPEYNSSITPLLKNTIDWVSRPTPGDDGPSPYRGKIAALLAASPTSARRTASGACATPWSTPSAAGRTSREPPPPPGAPASRHDRASAAAG